MDQTAIKKYKKQKTINKTSCHGSFDNDQAFRPDFHDIISRFLLLFGIFVAFGSNGKLVA